MTKCESDSRCGGFTFKGIPDVESDFEIFFFHAIIDVGDGGECLEWTYYLVSSRLMKSKSKMIYNKVLTIHILGLLSNLAGCLIKKLLNLKALMCF